VLLRSEVADGVAILAVQGAVTAADAPSLRAAIEAAVVLRPRGVLVDLSPATALAPEALQVLREAQDGAPGWPRPALVLCAEQQELGALLAGSSLPVHPGRADGLGHVDDRRRAPRRTVALEHSPRSPASARAAAAELVAELHLEPIADDVSLVVSELVTNAVRYADPPVTLEIQATDDEITIAVADGSPGRPAPREVDLDEEGGRGLTLIDLIAAETGVRPQPPGKTVWAALLRP
jgi:anti-sigma regulatory factor (Ser/Thr protein kinase)